MSDWHERVPKVELHVHPEGSIPLPTLWELISKYDGDPSTPDPDALRRRFVYRDFAHFIETWTWQLAFLREYDDFTLIAEAVARDFARQNVRYVEAYYSPGDFRQHGLATLPLTGAIRAGLERVPEVEVRLVADLVRNYGPERGAVTLSELREAQTLGVIGITIGGSEQEYPPAPFADVYEEARRMGFRTSAHAGEAAGPDSVWGAARDLRVDRIGHGTRASEDERLMDYLAERRIPIETCPISNVRTAAIPSVAAHPIRVFLDRGIPVSVNTDDPAMFGTSLAEEYAALERELGFTPDEIRALILSGIATSWMSDSGKASMTRDFEAHPSWRAD
ncbi:adenosine deaminase [Candidatus Poribacteria bacterium]|nr:adenosine deaminase [Candidatus Poribacteria bacterium]